MSGALFGRHCTIAMRCCCRRCEHNAIFQCLPSDYAQVCAVGVRRILLTAGGPFRDIAPQLLADVSPEQACAHPNWSMGRKISVDSASMMNKGLELIEACWLFNARPDVAEVVIHLQSVIHSMVDYVDGSVLNNSAIPTCVRRLRMRGMAERIDSGVSALDLCRLGDWISRRRTAVLPCLRLARPAAETGDGAGDAQCRERSGG